MENKYKIELSEQQLRMISDCVEFASRFHCGQIGHTYLPYPIQELFYRGSGDKDWKEINMRRENFNILGSLMKNTLHPELSANQNSSYGVNKFDYSDNLYDIYKMINYQLHKYNYGGKEEWSVNSNFTKFGNLENIKVEKI